MIYRFQLTLRIGVRRGVEALLIALISIILSLSVINAYSTPSSIHAPGLPQNLNALLQKETLNEAEVQQLLSHGRNAYSYGIYAETALTLRRLIEPTVLINNLKMLEETYKYLGLSYFYLGQGELARRVLIKLIYLNPDYSFDAARVPPAASSLLRQIKIELQSKLELRRNALDRQDQANARRRREQARQFVMVEQQLNQRLIAWVPFGAGQFQNRDEGFGYFFLASELIAIGLSAGFFMGVESLRQTNGRYDSSDYQFALQLQRAQVISGGVALGLIASGIIHALWNFKERHELGNYLDPQSQYEDVVDEDAIEEIPIPPEPLNPSDSLDPFEPLEDHD